MKENNYAVIMAGGIGSRFWPMSTEKNPKQFLKLVDNKSLILLTYERLLNISSKDKIFIITSEKYKDQIKEQIPEVNLENVIYEPNPKNTAPAIYLATKHILNIDNHATIGIYPADHYIKNNEQLYCSIKDIESFIINNKQGIVTIGLTPNYPSTSYGYINIDEDKENQITRINKFIEKPSLEKASQLIKDKNNLWNSGMFFFNAQTMINELDTYAPKIGKLFSKIKSLSEINEIWNDLPSESIDYAVMEKTKEAYCVQSPLEWTDLGTWMALFTLLDKVENNNVIKGNALTYDASDNLIISHNKLTAVVGLDNIAVINLKDRTLVINLNKSEDVRNIMKKIENSSK